MAEGVFGFNAIALTLAGLLTTAATLLLLGMGKLPEPMSIVMYEEEIEEHSMAPLYTTPALPSTSIVHPSTPTAPPPISTTPPSISTTPPSISTTPTSISTTPPSTTTGKPIDIPDSPFLFDLKNFYYFLEPSTCTEDLLGVVLVTSYYFNVDNRNDLRRMYPDALFSSLGLRRVFLLGAPTEVEEQAAIDNESRLFNDILQGNFIEHSRNLTYKSTMGLLWAYKKCRTANFVIKVRDSTAVNIFKLANLLHDELYAGAWRMSGRVNSLYRPNRNPGESYYLSEQEYPGDVFPDYLATTMYFGPTVMMGKLAEYASENIPYLDIEDVLLTGIAREKMFSDKSVLHDIANYEATDAWQMECCIRDPNVECFFIAGSCGGNAALFLRFLEQAIKCSKPNACAPAPDPEQLQC